MRYLLKAPSLLWERLTILSAVRTQRKYLRRFSPIAVLSGDYVSLRAMLQGRFELRELGLLQRDVFPMLKTKAICIDIGANIGNHSVFFSEHFDEVIGLEPHPIAFDLLQLNAKWYPRIKPLRVGASDTHRTVKATMPFGNLGGVKISLDGSVQSDASSVEFDCRRVDELIPENRHQDVGFVKIDVEGHEYEAMRGCEKIIASAKPIIAFELLREDHDRNRERILAFLREHGYSRFLEFRWGRTREIKGFRKKNYKMVVAIPG
jgi:FkbM family methyltransferase